MNRLEDRVARSLVSVLGHSPEADWERVFVGGFGQGDPSDLASLCRALARTAIEQYRQSGRPQEDMAPFEEVECALSLFRELKRTPGQYVAVKIDGPSGWTTTKPRTPQAMFAALATEEDMSSAKLAASEIVKRYTTLSFYEREGMIDAIFATQGTSAFGQDPKGLEAKPAGPVPEGDAPKGDHP